MMPFAAKEQNEKMKRPSLGTALMLSCAMALGGAVIAMPVINPQPAYAAYYQGEPGYDHDGYYWIEDLFTFGIPSYLGESDEDASLALIYGVCDEKPSSEALDVIDYDAGASDSLYEAVKNQASDANELADVAKDYLGIEYSTGATFAVYDYEDVSDLDPRDEFPEPVVSVDVKAYREFGGITMAIIPSDVLEYGHTYVVMQTKAPKGYGSKSDYGEQWYQFCYYGNSIRFDCNNKSYDGSVMTGANPIWVNTKVEEPVKPAVNAKLTLAWDFAARELTDAKPGDKVSIDYSLLNDGDVTINDIKIENSLGIDVKLAKTSLAPGETVEGTVEYELTAEDIAAGKLSVTAVATGVAEGTDESVSDESVTSNEYTSQLPVTAADESETTPSDDAPADESEDAGGEDDGVTSDEVSDETVTSTEGLSQTGAPSVVAALLTAVSGTVGIIASKISAIRRRF